MKLITWNIQWGLGMDGRVDLARIVAEARRIADFDVLCVQEVADGFSELEGHAGGNQFAELAALLSGYTAVEGVAVDLPAQGGRRRRFGSMILSRLPVGRILRHALPWDGDSTTRNMPRMLLDAEVRTDFGPLRVMTTHLEYFSAPLRARQVAAIREIYRLGVRRARQPPQAGVAHPNSFCIADQKYGPPHCCDFVFVSDGLVRRLHKMAYQTETRASDHQPVMVEFS